MSNGSITAERLLFREILLAQHGDVKNDVVLYHKEEVIFETQKVALSYDFKRP
jgi:hypothetical protein